MMTSPDKNMPKKNTPEKNTPEKSTPEKSASDKITPDSNLQSRIEHICEQGCTVVRQHIDSLESRQFNDSQQASAPLPEALRETTGRQQQEILDELKTIMAVYDNKDCNDNE